MPKYVYQGLTSGITFELEQRITESALTHHPETSEPVKRLIGRPAISFKGSGFYANDSKSSSAPKAAPGADVKSGDAEPTDAKPSESKAESSSPTTSSDASAPSAPTKTATSSPAPTATPAPAKSAD